MQSQAIYCSRCGNPSQIRMIDDRAEPFCPVCDAAVYHNPPPLAACLVLNERREVLLVKRARGEGQPGWSLPMDFINPNESLSDAARRILLAQTGLEGRCLRLIDAAATACPDRGDLFIVTVEMEKTGGEECPGSKVDTLAHHPHSRHPRLAYAAHEHAIRLCAEGHQEEWLIRDSFQRLQGDQSRAMLSDDLVRVIYDNSGVIVESWLEDVCKNPTTKSFAEASGDLIRDRVLRVITQFSRWLGGQATDRELADFWYELGRARRSEGFRNHEILSALMLLKKHIWQYAWEQGIWSRPIDVYRILELNRRIAIFFDKAVFHVTRGFEGQESS